MLSRENKAEVSCFYTENSSAGETTLNTVMSGAHAGYYASLNGILRGVLGNVFVGRDVWGGFHCSAGQGHLLGERGKQHLQTQLGSHYFPMKITLNFKMYFIGGKRDAYKIKVEYLTFDFLTIWHKITEWPYSFTKVGLHVNTSNKKCHGNIIILGLL